MRQLNWTVLFLVVTISLYPAQSKAQQVAPSVYAGYGLGTNLGGLVGVGTEVRIGSYVSVNAAVGTWPYALGRSGLDSFDFDVGVKAYPFKQWFYTGLNYGLIDEGFVDGKLSKTHGLTFSTGLRTPSWKGAYASGYVGVTDSYRANHIIVFDSEDFIPHFGLMLGYEF
jgi:hypothetical protein